MSLIKKGVWNYDRKLMCCKYIFTIFEIALLQQDALHLFLLTILNL